MVDAATKLAQQKARDERARRQLAIRDLARELVETPDGRYFRKVLAEMPDEDWRDFHFELMHGLRVPTPPSYDPRTLPLSGLPAIDKKQTLLAEEHRKRQQLVAAKRVEKLARMEVPGVIQQ